MLDDNIAVDKILEDSGEKRFCDYRNHNAGSDWCYNPEDCMYKNGFTLHDPAQDFPVKGCSYKPLLKQAERMR